jgi:hypothetical protein
VGCSKLATNWFVAKPYPLIIYINYKKSYKTICEKYSVVDYTFGRKFSAAKPMVYFPYSNINYKKSYKTICEKYSVVDLLKHDTFGRKFSAGKPMVYFPYSTSEI